jgi:hypothetical protein
MEEVLERVVSAKLGLQPYTHRFWIHGAKLHEDGWEALEESILEASMGLGWEAAYLPAGLQKICLRNHPLKSAYVFFGGQHILLSNLYFGASTDKEESMTDFAINLFELLNDIQHFDRHHLMKSLYGQLATLQGFKMTIKLGFNAKPGREGSYLSCSKVVKTRS